MISEFLIAEATRRFSDQPFSLDASPGAIITFPAKHPDVGDLKIYDDGGEARVEITRITHGHFGCWDDSLGKTEREKDIAETVLDFVGQLLDDKVLLHSTMEGRIGGWRPFDGTKPIQRKPLTKYFVWSGPVHE
jgi:hypothetical protein